MFIHIHKPKEGSLLEIRNILSTGIILDEDSDYKSRLVSEILHTIIYNTYSLKIENDTGLLSNGYNILIHEM